MFGKKKENDKALEDELSEYLPGTWLCEGNAGWKKWKKFYFEGRYYDPLTQESYNQLRNALKNQNSLDYILGRYPLPTSGVVITSVSSPKVRPISLELT